MIQYLNLLKDIKDNGEWKDSARPGMPRTKSIFSRSMRFDLQKGFPTVTTKKLYWKGVVGELIWFLKGDTNIKYLVDNNIHIWDDDAYKYYTKQYGNITKEEFLKNLGLTFYIAGTDEYDTIGSCGKIYGYQWRNFGDGSIDQIKYLIDNIIKNPNSRYHKVTAWNPTDFLEHPENAALPACHTDFQVYIRDNQFLDLDFNQRSNDTFLGVPFNIASYALLTHILADLTGYKPGELIWNGKDVHYYENHQDQVDEILTREPYQLPVLSRKDTYWQRVNLFKTKEISLNSFINKLKIDEFELINYKHHDSIKAPLSVGY